MKYLFSFLAMVLLLGFCSCNDNKMFEDEMYKKVFALVSSDNYNILTIEHDLDEPEITGYVSVSCGGTNPTEKDIRITLKEDLALFNRYNRNNFENESDFALLVPRDKYTIENFTFTLPAGEKNTKLPIKIRPEGLSPDSTYFISLKVDNYSDYEVNQNKADMLYRVAIKNYWALQLTPINYRLTGNYQGSNIIGNKRLFPLTYNQTRLNVGNFINFTADTAKINKESIIIEVEKELGEKIRKGTKYNVTVKPYKWITVLPIETPDPEYPNIFFIEDDGYRTYKTFRLHYRYQLSGDDTIYEMKEELRLEFVYQEEADN